MNRGWISSGFVCTMRLRVLLVFAGIALSGCGHGGTDLSHLKLPEAAPDAGLEPGAIYRAADPNAPPVTVERLAESERFWPHQVQLTRDWKPEDWDGAFGWGLGVLVRVDPVRGLRVDFSRFGKHWVPIEATDVVARAEAIRLGSQHKYAPNLVLALKNRLLDPSGRTLVETSEDPMSQRAFVLLFADPLTTDFELVARDLRAIERDRDVMLVLIAQGDLSDAYVYKACFDADYGGAFLLDRFTGAYTEGLLDEAPGRAWIQVASPEGRLLWEGEWVSGLGERLHARFSDS